MTAPTIPPKTKSKSDPIEERNAAALRKLREGNLSGAAQTLQAAPPAPANNDSVSKLREKHPSRSVPITAEADSVTKELFSLEEFEAVLKSLPRGKAAGNSGLRYEHFRCLASQKNVVRQLFLLATKWSQGGEVSDKLRPWIFGGRLMGLAKPNKDVRPICMNEVFVKIVAKAILKGQSEEISTFFPKGGQFGVSFSGGTEFVAKLSALLCEQHPESVIMSLDFVNAFNSVSRASIAAELKAHFPQMLPWFLCQYGHVSHLVFQLVDGHVIIPSAEGDHQGDPLAPFYFALAIHSGLQELRTEMKNEKEHAEAAAYLDDVDCVLYFNLCKKYFTMAGEVFKKRGLDLNATKSEITVRASLLEKHGKDWIPEGVELHVDGNRILGTPVGESEFIENYVASKISKTREFRDRIMLLPDRQAAFLLVRWCLPARFVHLTRGVDPTILRPYAQQFDALIRETLSSFLGSDVSLPESSPAWTQARLRPSQGGLGFLCAEWMSPGAYAGSWASFLKSAVTLKFLTEECLEELSADPDAGPIRRSLHTADELLKSIEMSLFDIQSKVAPKKIQNKLYDSKITNVHEDLLKNSTVMHQARLQMLATSGTLLWVTSIPSDNLLTIPKLLHQDALRFHLGLGPSRSVAGKICRCTYYFDPAADPFDHFVHLEKCSHLGGPTRRHDAVLGLFARMLRSNGYAIEVEPKHTFVDLDPTYNSKKRGDILALDVFDDQTIMDVAVVNGCQVKLVSSAAKTSLHAANYRAEQKERKYNALCSHHGYQFMPLVVETFGAAHVDVKKLIWHATEPNQRGWDAPSFTCRTPYAYWRTALSVTVARETARQVRTLANKAQNIA
jgi:hypothetical protein